MIDPAVIDLIAQAHSSMLAERALRVIVFCVGLAVLVHFTCMACVCDGRSVATPDAFLIGATGAAGLGVCYAAALCPLLDLLAMLCGMSACLIAFALRLWQLGFYVSSFMANRKVQICRQTKN